MKAASACFLFTSESSGVIRFKQCETEPLRRLCIKVVQANCYEGPSDLSSSNVTGWVVVGLGSVGLS